MSGAPVFKKKKRKRKAMRARVQEEDVNEQTTVIKKERAKKGLQLTVQSKKPKKLETDTVESNRSVVTGQRDPGAAVAIAPKVIPKAMQGKPKWVGPHRAPANIRIISVIDYNPSLCKDYKETGFCGYGDNCKFLHDRGDYKSGWQLEKEWKEEQDRKRRLALGEEVEDEEDYEIKDDDLPWACFVCRKDFTDPVVTKCEHYFCEKCALAHFATSTKCAACGEQTHGIFNTATKLINTIKMRKEKGLKNPDASDDEEEEDEDDDNDDSGNGGGSSKKQKTNASSSSSSSSAPPGVSDEPVGNVLNTKRTAQQGWAL